MKECVISFRHGDDLLRFISIIFKTSRQLAYSLKFIPRDASQKHTFQKLNFGIMNKHQTAERFNLWQNQRKSFNLWADYKLRSYYWIALWKSSTVMLTAFHRGVQTLVIGLHEAAPQLLCSSVTTVMEVHFSGDGFQEWHRDFFYFLLLVWVWGRRREETWIL